MLYLALCFFMVLPLFGVMVMEAGAISPFIDKAGAENGATLAYLAHLVFFFLGFYVVMRKTRDYASVAARANKLLSNVQAHRLGMACAVIFFVLAMLMLFGFGGAGVLTGAVNKADLRVSLGPFGAIVTLATKWIMPAAFAALVLAYVDLGLTRPRKLLIGVSAVCLFLFAISTGFKTTLLQMLLPTLILVFWKLRLRTLLLLVVAVVINVVGLSLLFDQSGDVGGAFGELLYRLTALQGDLAWYTWDSVVEGYETPPYFRTFLPIFGDSVLRAVTGANPERDFSEWASYYFGPAMTLFGGYPEEGMLAGVNNQATMFAEVLVVGGRYMFPAVSLVFGIIIGLFGAWLKFALMERRYALAATLATFFSFTILSWTLGNGLSSMFYLLNLFGMGVSYLLLRALARPARHYPKLS